MSLPLRLSKEVPLLLKAHPEGLTFDELVTLSILSGTAEWEAQNCGRSQVASDMIGTLGLADSPAQLRAEQERDEQCEKHIYKGKIAWPSFKDAHVWGEKDPELLHKWKKPHDEDFRDYHFMDWTYQDGKYRFDGTIKKEWCVRDETPERVTLSYQLALYARKNGLTNTQYLRMFNPLCINDVIAESKKAR